MRQADFARPRRAHPAANQPRVGNGVVRRAKRPLVQQTTGTAQHARNAVNLGGLNGLFRRERRQHARQTLGQHGLARTRRPDHQDVVRAGRGHFQGALRHGLSAHVAEIRRRRGRFRRQRGRAVRLGGRELLRPREQRHYFRQVAHAVDVDAFHHRGLGRILRRHDQIGDAHIARADRYRQRPAHRANRAIERQFSDQHVPIQTLHRAHRAQNPQRHR